MKFTKMQGTGNDFVVINAMTEKLPSDLSSFSKEIAFVAFDKISIRMIRSRFKTSDRAREQGAA